MTSPRTTLGARSALFGAHHLESRHNVWDAVAVIVPFGAKFTEHSEHVSGGNTADRLEVTQPPVQLQALHGSCGKS